MNERELLIAILEEQKKTNALLASMQADAKRQIDSATGKSGQADQIMQQVVVLLGNIAGGNIKHG